MPRNFLSTGDWTREELEGLLGAALRFKRGEDTSRPLAGRSVALVFFNPSLRTRASMQVGVYELGGNAVVLEPGGTSWTLEHREGVVMDGDKTEHVKEFVRVLARYGSAIGVQYVRGAEGLEGGAARPRARKPSQSDSEVPVINLESAMHHPCQAMADMLTVREKLGRGAQARPYDVGVAPEAAPRGRAEQLRARGGADGPRPHNRAPARLRVGRRTSSER